MECDDVFGENGLPMADVTQWFSKMGIGLLLLQQKVKSDDFDLLLDKLRGKVRSKRN